MTRKRPTPTTSLAPCKLWSARRANVSLVDVLAELQEQLMVHHAARVMPRAPFQSLADWTAHVEVVWDTLRTCGDLKGLNAVQMQQQEKEAAGLVERVYQVLRNRTQNPATACCGRELTANSNAHGPPLPQCRPSPHQRGAKGLKQHL